jgi:hypothetical protein
VRATRGGCPTRVRAGKGYLRVEYGL